MQLLDDAAVTDALVGLGWEREGDGLVKVVRRQNFADALAYVNEIAAVAEQIDHHPDVEIRWNTVTLRLWTHSRGGITNLDVTLAQRIDALD